MGSFSLCRCHRKFRKKEHSLCHEKQRFLWIPAVPRDRGNPLFFKNLFFCCFQFTKNPVFFRWGKTSKKIIGLRLSCVFDRHRYLRSAQNNFFWGKTVVTIFLRLAIPRCPFVFCLQTNAKHAHAGGKSPTKGTQIKKLFCLTNQCQHDFAAHQGLCQIN